MTGQHTFRKSSHPRHEVEAIVAWVGTHSRKRFPEIYHILRTDDESDEHVCIGTCHFESGLLVGAGIHGHRHE